MKKDIKYVRKDLIHPDLFDLFKKEKPLTQGHNCIEVELEDGVIMFEDNGEGLKDKEVNRYLHTINNIISKSKYSPYNIVIPIQEIPEDTIKYFYQSALEDEYLYYISSPLDPKKEFAVLFLADDKGKGWNIKFYTEFVNLLKQDNILKELNIQCIMVFKMDLLSLTKIVMSSYNLFVLSFCQPKSKMYKRIYCDFKAEQLKEMSKRYYSNNELGWKRVNMYNILKNCKLNTEYLLKTLKESEEEDNVYSS